jgi:hypothetical protein
MQRLLVYGCRSDTASPTKPDDVALSVTSFIDVPLTFAIMYGCTKNIRGNVTSFLKQIRETNQAWHPLLLPMLFAELERKRLLNLLDREKTNLQQRILEMENRLRGETEDRTDSMETNTNEPSAAAKDCEATKSWIEASKLKNGLESLRTQLTGMMAHSRMLRESIFAAHPDETGNAISEHTTGELMESRLNEMIAEFDCNIRSYDSLLGGMGMAAQMVRVPMFRGPFSLQLRPPAFVLRNGVPFRHRTIVAKIHKHDCLLTNSSRNGTTTQEGTRGPT